MHRNIIANKEIIGRPDLTMNISHTNIMYIAVLAVHCYPCTGGSDP